MRVSLFATCLGDTFFADACADAVRLLRRLDVEVDFPAGQTCCGQPAFNSGHTKDAERMIRHTISVFRDADYIVVPSGSCAGMVRAYYPEHGGRGGGELAARTFELSEFLVKVLGVETLGTGLSGRRVAYHHGCHALRELGVESEPLELLRGAGAEVVPWEADRECCGFGGLFSAKLPEVSGAMADHKLDTLPSVDWVTSADGGCLMQLAGRAEHRGPAVAAETGPRSDSGPSGTARFPLSDRFRHLASLLWEGAAP